MKIVNYLFSDISSLEYYIVENNIENSNKTLIQIYNSEITDSSLCVEIKNCIKKKLPFAMIMGTSSCGNILDGEVKENCIILSFSLYEKSFCKTISFTNTSSKKIIKELKNNIITHDTKLLILYADIFTFDANDLMNQLNVDLPSVVICGGYAGIQTIDKSSLVYSQDCDDAELIITAINSKHLEITTNYLFNWQEIGKKMLITKSNKNIIYEIDNEKASDIYKYYLGKDILNDFANSGLDFPLVFEENGLPAARVPMSLMKNGAVVLSGNIPEGSEVKFSFANIDFIEENTLNLLKKNRHRISEAIYVYSCVARKKIFAEYLNDEFNLLNNTAEISGFMTYGEFFHNCDDNINTLLNTTTTYITLIEKETEAFNFDAFEIKNNKKDKNSLTLKALSHLVDRTSQDLELKTDKLIDSNKTLERTISDLKKMQGRLIESEKMASLGALVAGVAHEINTPIGIGLTGITYLLDSIKDIKKNHHKGSMSIEEFEEFLDTSEDMASMIYKNLGKTADLVRSFKQVAVDQTSEDKRSFNLFAYIEETLLSIKNVTDKTNLTIELIGDKNINISSFPGAFSQIITNLILNSIRHGYEEKEEGNILLEVQKNNSYITLIYKDDGCGIPARNLSKIFDPFFTTNREKGGTGLGLNIIYNIVVSKLNGTCICKSEENNGVEFIISINSDILKEEKI